MAKPTIYQIADEAEVSYTAVSKILNSGKDYGYAKATVEKVQSIARKVGYNPNYFARALRAGKTQIIGIASGPKVLWGIDQSYMVQIYKGIGDTLEDTGYQLVSHRFKPDSEKDESLDLIRRGMLDGAVFIIMSDLVESFIQDQVPVLNETGTPYVLIHNLDKKIYCNNVGINNRKAGKKAAEHFLTHGYQKIGYVHSRAGTPELQDMYIGFTATLAKGGIPADSVSKWESPGRHGEHGYKLAQEMAKERQNIPRALFVYDDDIAFGMMEGFRDRGVVIPNQVAMIGFGDTVTPGTIYNRLTSVRKMALERGAAAAHILLDAVKHKDTGQKARQKVITPELTIRESCGCDK